jgi:ATP-binding cassette subfamily C protein
LDKIAYQSGNARYLKEKFNAQVAFGTWLAFNIFKYLPLIIGSLLIIKTKGNVAPLIAIYIASDNLIVPAKDAFYYYGEYKAGSRVREKLNFISKPFTISEENENGNCLPVELKKLNLSYGKKEVLKDFSMTINKGEKVLLTGVSGAGKTTISEIILGNLIPNSGEVKGGRYHIGYIRQTAIIFKESLAFNISLGEHFSQTELMIAIDKAGLRDFVAKNGLDFLIETKGTNLSGGECQRIEIARALIRRPELIIADEPTSNLDEMTSAKVFASLLDLSCAVLLITHNFDEHFANQLTKRVEI